VAVPPHNLATPWNRLSCSIFDLGISRNTIRGVANSRIGICTCIDFNGIGDYIEDKGIPATFWR
jgi:hypothetical protein